MSEKTATSLSEVELDVLEMIAGRRARVSGDQWFLSACAAWLADAGFVDDSVSTEPKLTARGETALEAQRPVGSEPV